MNRFAIVTALVLTLANECVHATAPPVTVGDAAPPSPCAAACANLARLQCKEGLDPTCAVVCEHASMMTNFHAGCLASATSKVDARLCESVDCN